LAKNGKTFGPYLPQEVEQMKLSGEFFEFEWLWDGSSPDWSRVPPPAPPPPPPRSAPTVPAAPAAAAQTAPQPAAGIQLPPRPGVVSQPQNPTQAQPQTQTPTLAARPQQQQAQPAREIKRTDREFQVICHDFHRLLSGTATQVTSVGCRLVCAETGHAPHLVPQSKVWMDLLDEKSDRSVTIKVTLGALTKEGDRWVYQVSWENNPLVQ
jgi:hypothetical protein